jgi:hypothetical protein
MTLWEIWAYILVLAGIGATLLGSGIVLTCTQKKWKIKRAVVDALSSTGTILAVIAFYAAFIVGTTELVLTVTNAFNNN